MGAGELVDKKTQRLIATVLYVLGAVFAAIVVGIWSVLLLNVSGVIIWPSKISVSTAVAAFGLSVTFCCAVAWFLNRISILNLADSTEAIISKLLIASILGTIATAIAKAVA